MDNVKRKVLLDLFAAPGTVIPVAVGLSALLVSWAVGGNNLATMIGIAGVLTGVGVTLSRWMLNLRKLTQQASDYELQAQMQQHQKDLQQLEASLVLDGDPRTESCLRTLREHYRSFHNRVADGEISLSSIDVTQRVEQLFHACIEQLRRSHELWEQAHGLTGKAKQLVLEERDWMVGEVSETTLHIDRAVAQFRKLNVKRDRTDLTSLREELDASLRVAKVVEQRMASWESPSLERELD